MRKTALLIVPLMFLLTGCGATKTQHPDTPSFPSVRIIQPNQLVVVRHNPLHQPGMQPFTKSINNVSVIKKLYTDLSVLPSSPKGPISCPNDDGVSYTLTFKHNNSAVLVVHAQDTGCRMVQLSKGRPRTRTAMSKDGASFWALLNSTLGLRTKN